MSKKQLLIVLGIWVMIFLFINFPSTMDKILALVTGLLIIVIAFKLRSESTPPLKKNIPYVEHKNSIQHQADAVSEQKNDKMSDFKTGTSATASAIINDDSPNAS